MSRYLCTFSGKFGDILWSLPTAKYIAEKIVGQSVDFAVMPYYANLLPLLVEQDYISKAFVIPHWLRVHSNHGDQPWQPPDQLELPDGRQLIEIRQPDKDGFPDDAYAYDKVWHLTYRGHPGISAPEMPLVKFTAWQQGITLDDATVVPFIKAPEKLGHNPDEIAFSSGLFSKVAAQNRLVSYCFNEQYAEQKKQFFEACWAERGELEFINVGEMGWREAAWVISQSKAFVGCRSANWVLAIGLGKKTFTFEPHPSRHRDCHLGKVFGSPWGSETALPFAMPAAVAGQACAAMIKQIGGE